MAEDTPLANAARAMQSIKPAQVDREEPPASRAFRDLTNHIGELKECVVDLVSRLDPVLSPEMSPGPAQPTDPSPPRSTITYMVVQEDEKIQALIHLVNDTFRRVEI